MTISGRLVKQSRFFSTSLRDLLPSLSPVGNPQGTLCIVGSGWAAYSIIKQIDTANYNVHVVSPKNHFTFTPLLASTSVGTLEFRSAIEPVRISSKMSYHQASCESIDIAQKMITCKSVHSDTADTFRLNYDKLVVAVGAQINTFGIKGVEQHANFLKDINQARDIRQKIIKNLEMASLTPDMAERKRLCTFAAIGSGPTGVEFSSELYDLVRDDIAYKFPHLMSDITISIYDVAPRILPTFDPSVSDYVTKLFHSRGIKVETGKGVVQVDDREMVLNDGSKVPYGLMIWSAGIKQTPLINSLQLPKDRMKRLLTDEYLRVLDANMQPIRHVYAIGDCATVQNNDLPCTAQVARQKGQYLSRQLNLKAKARHTEVVPFEYKHRGSMAYVGGWKAVVQLENGNVQSGRLGWLIWRGAYMSMLDTYRNKMKVGTDWVVSALTGREMSHFS